MSPCLLDNDPSFGDKMVSHTHISTLVNLCIKECLDVMCFEWLAPWMAYPQLLLGYGDPFWWALLLWEVRHATDFQSIWQTRWSSWMETGLWCLNRLSKVSQHTAKCLTHCKGFEKKQKCFTLGPAFFRLLNRGSPWACRWELVNLGHRWAESDS